MARTPEQRAADDALTAAVEQMIAAYGNNPESPTVLTDYLVLVGMQGFDRDGDSETWVMSHPRDGNLPLYRQLGLLDYVHTRDRALVAGNADTAEES